MSNSEAHPPDRAFELRLRPGWIAEPDEEGGTAVSRPDGVGLLHLVSFPQPADEEADPAEELYAFLDEQGIEIEEEDVEDLDLAGGAAMSLCEYIAEGEPEEGEDEELATYWLMAVATAPGSLVFASYSCPEGEEEEEREEVRSMLEGLVLEPGSEPGGFSRPAGGG